MGFVYNNPCEGFCRTFLEMNGWLVQSNLFTDLLTAPKGPERYRYEADIVAFRPPNTHIYGRDEGQVTCDQQPPERVADGEFWAGHNGRNNLVYCEIRANFSEDNPRRSIAELLAEDGQVIKHKAEQIERRFQMKPRVVVMGMQIDEGHKQQIHERRWEYKEFEVMFKFVRDRFHHFYDVKGRIAYNDPWLEMVRFLTCLGRRQG